MTGSALPSDFTLGDITRNAAIRDPEVPAMYFESQAWTYAELNDEVRALSSALQSIATKGDRIAILAENLPEYVFAYYGVPAAGMALTMLNHRLIPREWDESAQDAGAKVILLERKYYDALNAAGLIERYDTVVIIGGDAPQTPGVLDYRTFVDQAPAIEPPQTTAEELAWIIFTSGTTGRPKGAMLSHRNLYWAIANSLSVKGRGEGAIILPWPMCHVAGFIVPMVHMCGRTLVLMRTYDPVEFLKLIEKHRICEASVAPTMLNMLLRHPEIDNYDLSSLHRISYGAAPMPLEVLKRAMARFGDVEFSTGFGMTELAGNVLSQPWESLQRALHGNEKLLSSVGRTMPFGTVRVVDEAMADVAVGEVGEIVVRAPQVMIGYWNRPEVTDEDFAHGWFHTGDLGSVDEEGNLYIVDRKKDVIVTGGENVASREVEEVLYQHPSVAEAAVVAQPDENWGEIIVAVIQLVPGAEPDADSIVALCRDQLASYKKPRRVLFIDELPRNAAGKILKRDLRDGLASGSLA
ncbi:MAG: class I adenylate-forming enzyme family protein [Cumulibacter sp.]